MIWFPVPDRHFLLQTLILGTLLFGQPIGKYLLTRLTWGYGHINRSVAVLNCSYCVLLFCFSLNGQRTHFQYSYML